MPKHSGVTVKLTGVHLCCGGCVDAVDGALRSVNGVISNCDMENGTVTFTASDAATAQQALDAFAAAGFYGRSDNPSLGVKPVSSVPNGKVKHLTVSGIHNCCGPCAVAIKEAIAAVDGVTAETVQPLATTFEVTGNFAAAPLVKAINSAGFSAQVA